MNDQAQDERAIFFAALERPAGPDRDAYLREACSGESDLLNRVRWLFSLHEQSVGPLDAPPPGLCLTAATNQPTEQPGNLIGPYKLLEQIGEGGMGVVFVAEQTEPVRRRVALKIIKPGMDTKQVIARFEAERQALAMMDHPNIAKILDAGTVGQAGSLPHEGRPYFVMELVRGMPITEYCDKARLSPRQRLELFVDVCQAVQHAHQKGIIHRDLKPSNVMVTMQDGRPVVKVIDFGVAKAVGQQLTERTVYTALTQLVGTPLYMSPEQAELTSHDVDTRSDVYSLGVLLYELLTGQTPFDKEALSKAGFDEMRRMIREDEPLRPSRRFSTLGAAAISTASQHRGLDERRLSKILCGELDWIVMKALEKDRSRRYESASALATDIQRYLSDEPVLACPPTTMYRFQKFARKHRPALATAAAIAACLILGTTVSAWQAVRATTAEAQANANAAQAQEKAKEATEQRDDAQRQRDEVKALNEKLQATQTDLRSTLYAAHINLAKHAWESSDLQQVQELLAGHRPKPEQTDVRGFEWHYLNRLCNSELLALKGHTDRVTSIAYSPDGKRLASGSWYDETMRIWDAQTGQELLTLKGGGGGVAFSPDGKRIASGSGTWDDTKKDYVSGEVKVWDSQTGQQLLALKGHSQRVDSVAYSPDGKHLASADWGGTLKIWDAKSDQELISLKDGACFVAYSPDGKRMVTASDETAKVRDAQTGQELLTLKGLGGSDEIGVAFSPDGKLLATMGGEVKVWNAETGQLVQTLKDYANVVAFSPDGKHLASGSSWELRPLRLWDVQTGKLIRQIKGPARVVAFSPDGSHLASSSEDNTVKVWDAQNDQESISLPADGGKSIVLSPDWRRVATVAADNALQIKDAQSGQVIRTLKGHTIPVRAAAFSPDGTRLASGGGGQGSGANFGVGREDKSEVKVWDAATGQELFTFRMSNGSVWSVVFSRDGKRLAAASLAPGQNIPPVLKVWDVQTGQELLSLTEASFSLAFSPDGKSLACGAKVVDAQSGKQLFSLQGAADVAFSSDGTRLITSGRSVKIWDALTGQEIAQLKGGRTKWNRNKVVISPDGKRIAALDADGKVTVIDSHTGLELTTLSGSADYFPILAFSPDGHRLACSGPGGTLKIYDATPLPEKP